MAVGRLSAGDRVCQATPKCFGILVAPTAAEVAEMLAHLVDPRQRPVLERAVCVGRCDRCGSYRYVEVDA